MAQYGLDDNKFHSLVMAVRRGDNEFINKNIHILEKNNTNISRVIIEAIKVNNLKIIETLYDMVDENANFLEGITNIGLVRAAEAGRIKMVKYFVSKGADIHFRMDWALKGAINYSIGQGSVNNDIIKYLIEKGADIFVNNGTLFRHALLFDELNFFIYLYSKRNEHLTSNNNLIQRFVIETKKLRYIKNFVEKYPDDVDLDVLLQLAVKYRCSLDIIKYLTKKGANIFSLREYGGDGFTELIDEEYVISKSAICVAIQTRQDKVVRFFTEKVIIPNRYSVENFFRMDIGSLLDRIVDIAERSFPQMARYFDDPMLHAFTRRHRRNVGVRQLEDADPFLAQTMGIIQDFVPDEPAPGQFY